MVDAAFSLSFTVAQLDSRNLWRFVNFSLGGAIALSLRLPVGDRLTASGRRHLPGTP